MWGRGWKVTAEEIRELQLNLLRGVEELKTEHVGVHHSALWLGRIGIMLSELTAQVAEMNGHLAGIHEELQSIRQKMP
jgi:hypothetical protein